MLPLDPLAIGDLCDSLATHVRASGAWAAVPVLLALGDEWTTVTDVPAGEIWAFELTWYDPRHADAAATHRIVLTASAY